MALRTYKLGWLRVLMCSPPVTPIIPQAESGLVYNIQYFPRDKRRIAMRAAAAAKIAGEAGAEADLAASTVPAVPNQTYKWKTGYRPILEQSNNGYTL
ncbi:hypothetical protein H632_c334p1 [Helicosporidium sp. ATCC 50920]|nr:hypothetical protein H632_c334p1 [Helicosporidium sp. ATCC 50920]|eukprot:KDD76157.1 hypothetical protein H632_c334p1 [Helicosporidium sp. ATCC 50920]